MKLIKLNKLKFNISLYSVLRLLLILILWGLAGLAGVYSIRNHDYYYLLFSVLLIFISVVSGRQSAGRKLNLGSPLKPLRRKLVNIFKNLKHRQTRPRSPTDKKSVFFSYLPFLASGIILAILTDLLFLGVVLKIPSGTDITHSAEISLFSIIRAGSKDSLPFIFGAIPITLFIFFVFSVFGKNPLKKIIHGIFSLFIMLGISSFFSLILSLQMLKALAYADASHIYGALTTQSGAKSMGIIQDPDEMVKHISGVNKLPKMVAVDGTDQRSVVSAVIESRSRRSPFYVHVLIPKSAVFSRKGFDLPIKTSLLSNNTLIVTAIDKDVFEKISPSIARMLISGKFDPSYIKEVPEVKLMGRQEYMKYREDNINKDLEEIDGYIEETRKNINYYYGQANYAKSMISANESSLKNARDARQEAYDSCMDAGYFSYFYGYIKFYTKEECENRKDSYNSIIDRYKQNISDWQATMNNYRALAAQEEDIKETLLAYRILIETQKTSTSYELGLFEPPSTIKVVLESVSDKALADYYAILVHEYLHYSSYVSEEKVLPNFFEEGLTEYYARGVIKENLSVETNVGYPIYVPIIEQIAQDIPEDSLQRIYFTKDTESLKAFLNDKYGKDFYSETEYYFNILGYLSKDEALKVANNILFKVNGKQLTESDIYSTLSDSESVNSE